MNPLVTVIALCYNHEKFVREALESVLNQTYPNIELIVVDDASTDNSNSIIQQVVGKIEVKTIFHKTNAGNCKSFNEALGLAKGEFVVDFATDDVMLPQMLEKQVESFNGLSESTGLLFANAVYIDEKGRERGLHYEKGEKVPDGDVYEEVLKRFFIAPPSMIMRKSMLDELGGYDEDLAYEDFDIWVRGARDHKFYYLPEVVVKKRVHGAALSGGFYKPNNKLQESTFRVCQKALWLNRNDQERRALVARIQYEKKIATLTGNFSVSRLYNNLLKEIEVRYKNLWFYITILRINLYPLFSLYQKVRKF